MRQWKLSPMDLASLDKWDSYTTAKETMFLATDTDRAPWTVVKSNDKKRARLEAMRHVLHMFDYDDKDTELVTAPDSLIVGPASRIFEDGERPGARLGPHNPEQRSVPAGSLAIQSGRTTVLAPRHRPRGNHTMFQRCRQGCGQ